MLNLYSMLNLWLRFAVTLIVNREAESRLHRTFIRRVEVINVALQRGKKQEFAFRERRRQEALKISKFTERSVAERRLRTVFIDRS